MAVLTSTLSISSVRHIIPLLRLQRIPAEANSFEIVSCLLDWLQSFLQMCVILFIYLFILSFFVNSRSCICLFYPIFTVLLSFPLRKHTYSNILKLLQPKNENFQIKNSDIFYLSAQNIDCGYSLEPPRRGGSNEHPQSTLLSRNKKIMYTPVLLYKSGV